MEIFSRWLAAKGSRCSNFIRMGYSHCPQTPRLSNFLEATGFLVFMVFISHVLACVCRCIYVLRPASQVLSALCHL